MRYFFNSIYLALLVVIMPRLVWSAIREGKYRQGWGAKLWGNVPQREGNRPCIWFHAVSVGEVNLLRPILTRLERLSPETECVISTTTRTGFELAQAKYAERTVFYCPLDFSWAVSRALRRIRPDLLVLAELEIWPNLIAAADRAAVPVAVVNGRLSAASFAGYRKIRPWIRSALRRLSLIAVQTDEYAERFRQLGAVPDRVVVTGSVKFDDARTCRQTPAAARLSQLAGLDSEHIVFLAGSTQEPEEQLAIASWQCLSAEFPQLRLILVPRHPQRFEQVARQLDQLPLTWRRRSELSGSDPPRKGPSQNGPPGNFPDWQVLLVDTVGELSDWWATATVGFVGGSLGSRGGQNMIEPAGYGVAVCFGPNTQNFRDVVQLLLGQQAAQVIGDGEEMTQFVGRCLREPAFAQQLGGRAQKLVAGQKGATDRTVELLLSQLGQMPVAAGITRQNRVA